MPSQQGPRRRRASFAFLGLAGILVATLFAVIASLAARPAEQVPPFPQLPGPVIAGGAEDDIAPTTTPIQVNAAPAPVTASATVTRKSTKPKPKPSTTQAALPPRPGPPPAQRAPVARFTASCSGLSCTFDGAGSTDPDGAVVYFAWGFGDGTNDDLQNRSRLSHRFPRSGSYRVTLVVLDNAGVAGQVTRTVTVPPLRG
ncbi:MAG TPA: PKD domain-containing protein [Actinophytocola sp.]|uniref:PKD domain-containing protein n=1 Tax=Actinophytocola sp. TaxID=1872138 RepID=UPI002DBC026C|nr:PKD domain-containing protein [Actinophytocola sp.]HEU5470546.1 PKD domain-containing protein [Actinophytocola sp.]